MAVTTEYWAIYDYNTSEPAVGLVVVRAGYDSQEKWTWQAMVWDNRRMVWAYDPTTASARLGSEAMEERRREIDRAEAEEIAQRITYLPLPTEEWIIEAFRLKAAEA